jgi:hypothetical protein
MGDDQRAEVGEKARRRTLREHTAAVRAREFDTYISASLNQLACSKKRTAVLVDQSASAAVI